MEYPIQFKVIYISIGDNVALYVGHFYVINRWHVGHESVAGTSNSSNQKRQLCVVLQRPFLLTVDDNWSYVLFYRLPKTPTSRGTQHHF